MNQAFIGMSSEITVEGHLEKANKVKDSGLISSPFLESEICENYLKETSVEVSVIYFERETE